MIASAPKSILRLTLVLLVLWAGSISELMGQSKVSQPKLTVREERNKDLVKRQGIKEAKGYESDYKETHLNTQTYSYKSGKAGRKDRKGNNTTTSQQKERKVNKGIKHRKPLFNRLTDK